VDTIPDDETTSLWQQRKEFDAAKQGMFKGAPTLQKEINVN